MDTPESILDAIPTLEPDIPASSFQEGAGWLVAAVAVVLLALLAAFLIWRKRRRAAAPPPAPDVLALEALDRLEAASPPLRACCLELSFILRRFLTGRTQDPALFETHEEFTLRMDALTALPEACRQGARLLLDDLAEQKYAPAEEDDPVRARELLERTRELVRQITLAAEEEEKASDEPSSTPLQQPQP